MYFSGKEYVKSSGKYQAMLADMKERTEEKLSSWQEDSRLLSGWGHAYFCNEDGGRLLYDPKQPFAHKCSICGKVYRAFLYNSCHVTITRNLTVVEAENSGVLYQLTGETRYAEYIKKVVEYYAAHYEEFPIHAKDKLNCDPAIDAGGAGRIMPQGLNEAIMSIRLVNALELIKDTLSLEWKEQVKEKLFAPIVELLLPQKQKVHNIPVWLNSAIGELGLFFGEETWVKEAVEAPYNLYELLRKGVTESGFWYEGSIHYHFFALEGVLSFLAFAEDYGLPVPEDVERIVFQMLKAPYYYAFDNDIFPNPSDGWPNISLKTYLHLYYMGYHALGEKMVPYIKRIEEKELERPTLPLAETYYFENRIPLERLLFAPDIEEMPKGSVEERISENFEASNCAILRSPVYNVFFKYGHQTESHAHPDKMNVEIMVKGKVLTRDLSNSGYGSKMCNEWHRKLAAHNTCAVDGRTSDISHSGQLMEYTGNQITASAEAYEGVQYTRNLALEGEILKDVFQISMEKEGTMDWFFHLETPVDRQRLTLTKVPLESFREYGADYMREPVEVLTEEGKAVLQNKLAEMTLQLPAGAKLYLVKTYNNPADKMRDTLVVRVWGKEAVILNCLRAL